jgi:hypothetical protein
VIRRPSLRTLLGTTLVLATVVFLGVAIARNWAQVVAVDWDIRPVELLLSILLLIAAMGWGVAVWHRVLLRFDAPAVTLPTLLRIWFLSNLARYVPGKIWQFVGAVQLGRGEGIAPSVLLTSMVIHTALTLVSAAVVSLAALPALLDAFGGAAVLTVVLAATAGLVLVHPTVLNFGLRLVPERFADEPLAWQGSWARGIGLLVLAVMAWLIYGSAFALFADSLVGVPTTLFPALIAANALAFLVGYMVLVTPGGLGAREAALAVMLGPVGSLGVAAVLAVAFRLWLITGEVLGAALVMARPGQRSRSSEAESR